MDLQNLCLSTIVENFGRYYNAFSTSEDEKLKQMLEFLRRIYSYEISTLLNEECEMKAEYADFLINKYLKILDTNWLADSTWKEVVAKFAEIGPNLKKIYFYEYSENRPWEEIICYLPNLEVMEFPHNCNNKVLSNVAKFCPDILEIDVTSSDHITEDGFKSLCKKRNGKVPCPKLKKLNLKYVEVAEPVAICLIKNLPSLEVFEFYDLPLVLYSMHVKDLHELDKIPPYKLKKIDFSSFATFPNNLLKVCLSVCPFLTNLACPVKEPGQLNLISGLHHLEKLRLDFDRKENININSLLKSIGRKLVSLKIGWCSVSVLTLNQSCPALKSLTLNLVNFDQHDGSIPLFNNLESVRFFKTELDNSDNLKSVCLILSSSPKLESITLEDCSLTSNEVKTEILKCCQRCCVKTIDFNGSSVDKTFVTDILLTCNSLKSFNLDGCGLSSDDEVEIYRCAEILPNNPDIFFNEQQSFDDYDFFDDYYDDNDLDDNEDYDDEYDDYLYNDFYEDEDEDVDLYGFFI